ncbi:MAG: hypothetical protein K9K37_04140 [Desulfocapsa sp.]|nr:hypothetical protein [Desulfocapsa sp.]
MRNTLFHRIQNLLLAAAFLCMSSTLSFAEETFGGLTFIGEREGVCIEISGECVREDILFELNTCDSNDLTKEKFKDRMPFTILVPKGSHQLVVKKDGKNIIKDKIIIEPEKVTEYQLP